MHRFLLYFLRNFAIFSQFFCAAAGSYFSHLFSPCKLPKGEIYLFSIHFVRETKPRNGGTCLMIFFYRTKRYLFHSLKIVENTDFFQKYPEIHFSSMHPGWADTPAVQSSMPGKKVTVEIFEDVLVP